MVQPESTPPTKKLPRIGGTAATTVQKLSAFNRGKAMSLAPIMIGMMKLANGPETMMIVAMIMTMPWIEISAL